MAEGRAGAGGDLNEVKGSGAGSKGGASVTGVLVGATVEGLIAPEEMFQTEKGKELSLREGREEEWAGPGSPAL